MMVHHRLLVLAAVLAGLASACTSEQVLGPPALVPVTPELRNAPQEVSLGGVTVHLGTYLWRDFQPVTPPDGKPLIAVLRVTSVDATAIPASVQADSAWVLNTNLAWATAVHEEQPRGASPASVEVVARGGPKWGPGIDVDVVVRLHDAAGTEVLLQARGQFIERTE